MYERKTAECIVHNIDLRACFILIFTTPDERKHNFVSKKIMLTSCIYSVWITRYKGLRGVDILKELGVCRVTNSRQYVEKIELFYNRYLVAKFEFSKSATPILHVPIKQKFGGSHAFSET